MADLYRGRMSLRQVWVRIRALPPDSPLWIVLRGEFAEAEEQAHYDDTVEAVNRYKPKG